MDPVLIGSGAVIVATVGYAITGINPERGYIPEFIDQARLEVLPPRRFRGLLRIVNPIMNYRYKERLGARSAELLYDAMSENAQAVTMAIRHEREEDLREQEQGYDS